MRDNFMYNKFLESSHEGRSLFVSISARLYVYAVICAKKSVIRTKACVSVIYVARLRQYYHFLRIHPHRMLLHSEISLVSDESSLPITAVLIDAEMCVSTIAFKYR